VTGFHFAGIEDATAAPEFKAAISSDELWCVIVCPSNPFVSVDPILLLPGVADALAAGSAPIVAVSPIVGGEAIKGPAAKMMWELDLPVSAIEVARHYRRRDLLDGFVLDGVDAELAPEIEDLGLGVLVTDTVMNSIEDRVRLAQETLAFARRLA
jgi:LPPG:FO 2-phospho-L-lactate transferase